MNKPPIQRTLTYIAWGLAGLVALGGVIGAINDAVELITPLVTYVGTIVIVVSWGFAQWWLRRYPIEWKDKGGHVVTIRKINRGFFLPILGMIVLLWVPRIIKPKPTVDDLAEVAPPASTHSPTSVIVSPTSFVTPQPTVSPTSLFFEGETKEPPAATPTQPFIEPTQPIDSIVFDEVDNPINQMFPLYVGYKWTYNFGRFAQTSPDDVTVSTGQYTEQILFIETGLSDFARIIAVVQTGEDYQSSCSNGLYISGDINLWYVVDDSRFYTACSRATAYRIANAISYEDEQDVGDILKTPEYIVPFEVGNVWAFWADLPEREDTNYQWHVQDIVDVSVPAGEFTDCFRLLFNTTSASTIRWVCPDVGLVAFEYHHYGTPNDYRAELVDFEFAESTETTSD